MKSSEKREMRQRRLVFFLCENVHPLIGKKGLINEKQKGTHLHSHMYASNMNGTVEFVNFECDSMYAQII